MKKLFIIFTLVLNLLCLNSAFAERFYIKNYDINMDVTENNLVRIVEDIDTYFTNLAHGIYRDIPIINRVVRLDNSKFINHAHISNIWVDDIYRVSSNNGMKRIIIGDPNRRISGDKSYKISYDYQLQHTNLKYVDEFYFNIIGPNWNTNINKVSFRIKLPKPFDESKVGFSLGSYGRVGHLNEVKYEINNNVISGYVVRPLIPNEALTIRVELPKGYFTDSVPFTKTIIAIIAGVLTLFIFVRWYTIGRDDKVTPTVEFYPPKGLNSAEVGAIFSENASDKDIISLLFYLADKKYIEIIDDKFNFTIKKLKEYDGKNEIEMQFMEILFAGKNSVTKNQLKYSETFYLDIIDLRDQLKAKLKDIYNKDSIDPMVVSPSVFALIFIGTLLYYVTLDFSFFSELSILVIFFGVIFPILGTIGFIKIWQLTQNTVINRVMGLTVCPWFFITPFAAFYLNEGFGVSNSPFLYVYLFISLIFSTVCVYQMPKKKKVTIKLLGHILGFKKFIEAVEINRLKLLLEKDPEYCFKVLSFAYVFGYIDKWIKKFESLALQPDWYKGRFNSVSFDNFSDSFTAISRPSIDNGGITESSGGGGCGSSGGGCSGGGSGGGGGGSW